MTKVKRLLAFVLTLVMITLSLAPLSSCGDEECTSHVDANGDGVCDNEGCGEIVGGGTCTNHKDNNNDGYCDTPGCNSPVNPAPAGKVNYVVELKTVGGYKLSGIILDLVDTSTGDLVTYSRTNAQGLVTFTVEPKTTYAVRFGDGAPAGYKVQEEYPISQSGTVITLVTELQPEGHAGVSYQLGDIMHDFTVVDSAGEVVKLSELLKTKKAVVLNFWYVDCSWCGEEFPDIIAAYNTVYDEESGRKYSDDIEIVALNASADTASAIRSYVASYGLNFPVAKDTAGVTNAFGVSSFPTTVVIDRYGMITIKHSGALLGASYWKKMFSYFSSDNYVQKTANTFEELIPAERPDVEMPSSDVIAEYFKGDDGLKVSFHPETKPGDAEYSWPFLTKTLPDGTKCIYPSNSGKDGSYATIYANVELKAGDALMFDYHSSTEWTDTNADVLYVIVNGKDMYSIAGVTRDGDEYWKRCCTYVAEEDGAYEVAFTYLKDSADDEYEGVEDVVYLTNLRVVTIDEIDVETYIYRFADKLDMSDLVVGDDGYYHIGTANGPILLANLLGYTNFEAQAGVKKTVSERITEAGVFNYLGENKYNHFINYANYGVNSRISGYTSVTPELYGYLDAYVSLFASSVGVKYTETTWLSLCAYYDAYGTGGVQMEDPIRGLATFSAFDTVETLDPDNPQFNNVKFETVVMPRGYLYKFSPTTSGVYRVITQSDGVELDERIDAWVFVGDHNDWSMTGDRWLYVDSTQGERYCEEFIRDVDGDGVLERDLINASMVAYFEEGKEYYLAFGYFDLYNFDSFTFTVTRIADEFNAFFEASPGTFTYEEGLGGAVGNTISGGIDLMLNPQDDYYYHVISKNTQDTVVSDVTTTDKYTAPGTYYDYDYSTESGRTVIEETKTVVTNTRKSVTVTRYMLGSKIYADFLWPTNIFTTRTMQQLIDAYAFDFTKTSNDLEALAIYTAYAKEGIRIATLYEPWLRARFDARWEAENRAESDAVKEAEWLDYYEAMNTKSTILEPIFEKKWVDEGRETELRNDGYSATEIQEIKVEEYYSFYAEEFAGLEDYEILFEGMWITHGKEAELMSQGYTEAEIAEIKREECEFFVGEKTAWDNYFEELDATKDELITMFNVKWISEGKESALKGEGKTNEEIKQIKKQLTDEYVDGILAKQADWKAEFESVWAEGEYDKIAKGLYTKTYYDNEYSVKYHKYASEGFSEYYGYEAQFYWRDTYDMDSILIGNFHGDIYSDLDEEIVGLYEKTARAQLTKLWGAQYGANWASYRLNDVVNAFKKGNLAIAELNSEAVEIFKNAALEGLMELWGESFDANWEKYQIDDILQGKFHNDYTAEMQAIYDANMIFDGEGNLEYDASHPERQGCVAVDSRLAEILQQLMDKYTFIGVENSWAKVCYYYKYFGPNA